MGRDAGHDTATSAVFIGDFLHLGILWGLFLHFMGRFW
jgi:hypothetical protein